MFPNSTFSLAQFLELQTSALTAFDAVPKDLLFCNKIRPLPVSEFLNIHKPFSQFALLSNIFFEFPNPKIRVAENHLCKFTGIISLHTTNSTMDSRAKLFRALEAGLGSSFSSEPIVPNPKPLIIVISGPSGVGKDAVIKRLTEVREDLHFVVTATSRAKRPGEVDGKDYIFVSKEEFLKMIEKNELLEYALVYGDYKGVPKQQIREYMAKGCDIVLRVDIQGAATLRGMLRDSAVFVFLVAESEEALVRRLIDRKTETTEALLMRVGRAREELRHLKEFDYVVVNKEGELERSVRLVESIIEAERLKCSRGEL